MISFIQKHLSLTIWYFVFYKREFPEPPLYKFINMEQSKRYIYSKFSIFEEYNGTSQTAQTDKETKRNPIKSKNRIKQIK